MEPKRRYRKAGFAGTGALAVLSCALALLAGQPGGMRGEEAARPAAVRTMDGGVSAAATFTESIGAAREHLTSLAVVERREVSRAEAQARIQATWLMLRAWLAEGMIRPAATGAWDTLDVASFSPVAFGSPMVLGWDRERSPIGAIPPLPSERRHAIGALPARASVLNPVITLMP